MKSLKSLWFNFEWRHFHPRRRAQIREVLTIVTEVLVCLWVIGQWV